MRSFPAAIDAHLAPSDHSIDRAFRYTVEQSDQKVVESLPVVLRSYGDILHRRSTWRGDRVMASFRILRMASDGGSLGVSRLRCCDFIQLKGLAFTVTILDAGRVVSTACPSSCQEAARPMRRPSGAMPGIPLRRPSCAVSDTAVDAWRFHLPPRFRPVVRLLTDPSLVGQCRFTR